jgi:hypothetical protein
VKFTKHLKGSASYKRLGSFVVYCYEPEKECPKDLVLSYFGPGPYLYSLSFMQEGLFDRFLFCKHSDSVLKLGHDHFLPNPFQFIIHVSPFHSTLYSVSY